MKFIETIRNAKCYQQTRGIEMWIMLKTLFHTAFLFQKTLLTQGTNFSLLSPSKS